MLNENKRYQISMEGNILQQVSQVSSGLVKLIMMDIERFIYVKPVKPNFFNNNWNQSFYS